MPETTPFTDWFNIQDKEHVKAFVCYLDTKQWPKHFMPADVNFTDKDVEPVMLEITKAWAKRFEPAMRSAEPEPLEFGGQSHRR